MSNFIKLTLTGEHINRNVYINIEQCIAIRQLVEYTLVCERNEAYWEVRESAEEILRLASERTPVVEWVVVKKDGWPDDPGWYLCEFSDGSVETFDMDEFNIEKRKLRIPGLELVAWTDIPKREA